MANLGESFYTLNPKAFDAESRMADHLDSPSAKIDERVDITDVYLFHPGRISTDRTVLAVNVNPFAGTIGQTTFRPNDALYEIKVDTNGDALADVAFRFSFVNHSDSQIVTAKRAIGGMSRGSENMGDVIASGPTGSVTTSGDVKLFAGVRDDPFFFDLMGFLHGLNFTGTDFFAGANITAIILEVPTSMVGTGTVGIWARTLIPINGELTQVDRMGRPAINTVFIHGPERKDMFNAGHPISDVAQFNDDVVNTLLSLKNSLLRSQTLASVLLPDLLTFDVTKPSGFLNGRNLDDDVIDKELGLIIPESSLLPRSDRVNANDVPFLTSFPYMAGPH